MMKSALKNKLVLRSETMKTLLHKDLVRVGAGNEREGTLITFVANGCDIVADAEGK